MNLLNDCLKQVAYKNQSKVRSDVLEAMNKLQTLYPKVGSINFTNGTKKQLLNLYGTIPMMFRGTKYNIPMSFWIPETYPQSAPISFVSPTETMIIKPKHRHVDSQGRCYSPYLSRWNSVSCNLLGLLNDLSELFNQDPPVYQKPQTPTAASSSTTPTPATTATTPTLPTTTAASTPNMTSSMMNNYSMYNQPSPTTSSTSSSTSTTTQPPSYDPYATMQATSTTNPNQFNSSNTNEKNQLINKVRDSCSIIVKDLQEKIDNDTQVCTKLTMRARELSEQEMKLDAESPNVMRERNAFMDRESSLNRWIDSHEKKEMDVDRMIEPEDMHSRQVLELLAEDNAIDDLVWVLGEALHKKTHMDCDTYLNRVRQLGREQFMKRALLLKLSYKL